MDPLQRTVALMLFLRFWDEEPENMADERIREMVAKFDRDFLPSLSEPHHGDCTQHPSPCVRCVTENLLAEAKRITNAINRQA